jgi:hypothetical protein
MIITIMPLLFYETSMFTKHNTNEDEYFAGEFHPTIKKQITFR